MKFYLLLFLLVTSQSVFAQDVYRLETKNGDHVFNDILAIDSYEYHSFTGSLTVPGVFTTKVENAEVKESEIGKKLNFDINVHEGDQDYVVHYKIQISFIGFVTGTLSKDDEVLGPITGTQIYGGK